MRNGLLKRCSLHQPLKDTIHQRAEKAPIQHILSGSKFSEHAAHWKRPANLLEVSQDGQLGGIVVDHHQCRAAHALGLVSQQVAALRISVIRDDYPCRTHKGDILSTV